MKLGMNLLLWTAAADESHYPLLENLKSWGFDGVELPMFAPDSSPWPGLREKLEELELASTVVCVLPEDASLIAEEDAMRARGIEVLKASIDSCRELGAETLAGPIFHPVGSLAGRGPTDDERKRCIECLTEVADYAGEDGPAIAVEPLNRFETYFLNAQEDGAAIAQAVGHDALGILYDTFHANIEEKNPVGVIQSVASQIYHVHISANDRATPGEDHIDWPGTFAALKAIGYDGWLTIEAFGAWLPEIAGATCIWRKMAPSEAHIAEQGAKFVRKSWASA